MGYPVIQTFDITKSYKGKEVLRNVSITVNKGEIYGFVGRNGAGKTTLIRILCNLVFADSGTYSLNGASTPQELRNVAKKVASMVETPALYLDMTGEDNLRSRCYLNGVSPTLEVLITRLREVGLESVIGTRKKAKDYSLGMKQRLGIAMALMGDPEILLLDEPTNGLDPDGIKEIRDLLLAINHSRGVTILVSSHILSELSKLATRFGFIEKGVIVKEISSEELVAAEGRSLTIETSHRREAMEFIRAKYPNNQAEFCEKGILMHHITNSMDVVTALHANGIEVVNFYNTENSLEDYFIRLISGVQ